MVKPIPQPRLILSADYAGVLATAIEQSSHRVAIIATTLRDDDPRSHRLIESLIAARQRNVTITIGADIFTYIEPREFVLRSPSKPLIRAYEAIKLERHLKKHAIKFRWLGRAGGIILTGRTHTKWVVVDDTVYSFGGINLESESFDHIDYMFEVHNANLADKLFNEHLRLVGADQHGHAFLSHSFEIDEQSTVLVDGGIPGNSIIYRRAVTLAEAADKITLVSQYCPTGKLNKFLRQKNAAIYFNHWRHASWVNKAIIRLGMLFTKLDTKYRQKRYLHAKFMICTMSNGQKIAISGSHNFMFGSGIMGTREVALETSDPSIISQLESFLEDNVK